MRDLIVLLVFLLLSPVATTAQLRLADSFDGDLSSWILVGEHAIHIIDSGDPAHGPVLELDANGNVHALVKTSEQWGALRIEADILFPDDKDNYLGLIYNYQAGKARTDFGCLYIKGNGSYIRANPWYDGNASRLLYEEYRTKLEGEDSITVGRWHRIRAEVMGNACHFYVGDMSKPKITFDLFHGDEGLVGFQPRIAGWPVWVDNVIVTSIDRLSYAGPAVPAIDYEPEALLTEWEVVGPLHQPAKEIEQAGDIQGASVVISGVRHPWRPFETDRRGAVITARITEYSGERPVAYFRNLVHSETDREGTLHLTTADEIALWLNRRFEGFVYRDGYISRSNDWNVWHDFWRNPDHAGRRIPIRLRAGKNVMLIRVRNGDFATGGFFARIE
jgi:hypothetical protein